MSSNLPVFLGYASVVFLCSTSSHPLTQCGTEPPDVARVSKIEIVNKDGDVALLLGTDSDGMAEIKMFGKTGIVLSLTVTSGGEGQVLLKNDVSGAATILRAPSEKHSAVEAYGATGTPVSAISK